VLLRQVLCRGMQGSIKSPPDAAMDWILNEKVRALGWVERSEHLQRRTARSCSPSGWCLRLPALCSVGTVGGTRRATRGVCADVMARVTNRTHYSAQVCILVHMRE